VRPHIGGRPGQAGAAFVADKIRKAEALFIAGGNQADCVRISMIGSLKAWALRRPHRPEALFPA